MICGLCGTNKTDEEYAWKKVGRARQSYCRPCQKIYRKKHYENNKQKYINKARINTRKVRVLFFQWLSTQECMDCGVSDPRVLEFDHVKGVKEFNISAGIHQVSKNRLWTEIAKCDIVCANCHRIRTAERGNYYDYADVA